MVSRRIGERWAERGVLIPPEAIIIAATHTHQGPGNYLTSVSYNQYGSKYPGFDKRLLDFLADRVAEAIDSAIPGKGFAAQGFQVGDAPIAKTLARINTDFDFGLIEPASMNGRVVNSETSPDFTTRFLTQEVVEWLALVDI